MAKEVGPRYFRHCYTATQIELIPEVCSKVCFPTTRNIGISYCRMLLNNTMLNEDGFRTQVSDSPVCDCGTDYESVEHFLLECKLYSDDRKVMLEDIKEVLQSSKDSRYFKISVGLLLGQGRESCVTKSQNILSQCFSFWRRQKKHIESVFQFLEASKKNCDCCEVNFCQYCLSTLSDLLLFQL